jgi:RimJ/RimL family protein N-acetyltransferase
VGSPRLFIEQLRAEHLPELATQLRRPLVYEHIGGTPSLQEFILDRERALAGPGDAARNEHWLNYLVRERASRQMLGRLEATLHDSIAEVAFLFSPNCWGKGYATEALAWLHAEIRESYGVASFWATTVPENSRCQALLRRSGYKQVHAATPFLYSFDQGDLVFHLLGAA